MYDVIAFVLFGVFGLCIGSFLNVVIYRLPLGMSLAKPDSHCTKCNYFLKWYDNIPVLSYLMLGGKCRKCKSPISPRYMLVEIFTCLCFLACALLFWKHNPVYAVISALFCCSLICIFFIDLDNRLRGSFLEDHNVWFVNLKDGWVYMRSPVWILMTL